MTNTTTEGSIRVVSHRAGSKVTPEKDETVIYIDRSNALLGNPYMTGRDGDRDYSIERHDQMVDKVPVFRRLFNEWADRVIKGERIALSCWCKPKSCHGDNYVRRVEEIIRERKITERKS